MPIQVEAMSISHITNKMVEEKEAFIGSEIHQQLTDIFAGEIVLVAHNAQFDAEMLQREGVEVKDLIDTLKVAHHLDKEGAIPRYNLQYLRYYLDLDVEDAVAHNALGDVRVLEKLFERLFQKMLVELKEEQAVIAEMIEVSKRPILMKKFPFGKYKGAKVADIAKTDLGYLGWLLDQKIQERNQGIKNDENLIYTCEHYLRGDN